MFQLNKLIDTFIDTLMQRDYKNNPMLSQYNTIKYALLLYRICWKIQDKNIYQLITKCQVLNKFIMQGIINYLDNQNHMAQLYKLLREPILDLKEKKDSLDIMLEMNMDQLLRHPVIFEVLNLVFQG